MRPFTVGLPEMTFTEIVEATLKIKVIGDGTIQ